MARDVPPPVSTALQVLQAGISQVKKLPETAAKAPAHAVGAALSAVEKAKKVPAELLGKVGSSDGQASSAATQAQEKVEQGAEKAKGKAQQAEGKAEKGAQKAKGKGQQAKAKAKEAGGQAEAKAEKGAQKAKGTARTAAKDAPTPKAPSQGGADVDTAASARDSDRVEAIAEQVSSGGVPDASELPVADFDHMTLGQLRGRLRKMSVPELVQLRDYEKAHADRLPIVTMLDNRIAKLSADTEAERALPSDSSQDGSSSS